MALTPTVLVLRALGIGDLLTAVPALRGIRRSCPDRRIALAAPTGLAPLVELIGAVDELVPTAGLGALDFRGGELDLAVNLHGRGPESIADLLRQNPPRTLTYRHADYQDLPGPEWVADQHEVQRWCSLLEWFGIPCYAEDLDLTPPPEASAAPGAVVIHPGAASPARRWPVDRFGAVARVLADQGHRIVVTGSAGERPLAEAVADSAGLPPGAVLAGETSLRGTAAVVAHARLILCGDTGIAHLATAFRTPSVILFGPVSPAHWGPPRRPQHACLWSGRRGDPHGNSLDPGLAAITVEDVLGAVGEVCAEKHVMEGGLDV
ncbi:glycosyltransferase family 9 protein [Rhodococcus sp. MSC1_016]|jgi:ADP-heptose:LPS heptosyltransferase|uniref:glycosyltransferase family 9 protein n=1 Tax=Rhodococcus sp. MSC1_016 TaxID=2909266 RepID=UPI00202F0834|nr:glycosyltransferase family 9 protein [Rhodococcus sp. MSC1_016]